MATKRQVFYSFHYNPDSWRASQVRNIGVVEGNKPAPDNDWETITNTGGDAIKKWINEQMKYRSCTIVLVGNKTANRKWINYEIIKSWNEEMGIAGIYVHGLKNSQGQIAEKGTNPFDSITFKNGKKMSEVVKCYNPTGNNSKERYDWISKYISAIADEAVGIRNK